MTRALHVDGVPVVGVPVEPTEAMLDQQSRG